MSAAWAESAADELAGDRNADDELPVWSNEIDARWDGMTRDEAWAVWFAEHPEVLASWGHQNGRWPR